jgi:CHAT domain
MATNQASGGSLFGKRARIIMLVTAEDFSEISNVVWVFSRPLVGRVADATAFIAKAFLHRYPKGSRWEVDSLSTEFLMGRFYETLTAGVDVEAALNRAESDLRSTAEWNHPYFWASFETLGAP